MARGKGGLGRGLDSLFEDAAPVFESEHAAVETLPLREIEPDPDQPRKTFDEEALGELAASIAEHGLLQPIAVRPQGLGGYSIVAGERRWRACRMAGLTEVPVVVLPWGSRSTMSTFLPKADTQEDRLTAVVVLPTPPFWFAIATIFATRISSFREILVVPHGTFAVVPARFPSRGHLN